MRINSRSKGARGERLWRDFLRNNGFTARRGQQFAGGTDSPDVICEGLPTIHFEVKCVEKPNLRNAMEQAERDCGYKMPTVAHKKNNQNWQVTMNAVDWIEIIKESEYCK